MSEQVMDSDRFVLDKTFKQAVAVLGAGIIGLAGLWYSDHDKLTALLVQQENDTNRILSAIASLEQPKP